MKKKSWTGERLETFIYNSNTVEHLHRYAIARSLSGGKDVLDIASGEGYGTNLLAKVSKRVVGVDISTEAVEQAKRKYVGENLSFKTGSASAIPLPDRSVDVVVSFETLEHHDQHEAMMREIKRVLRSGGVLIMSSPDKKYYSDMPVYSNPFHVKELYFREFKDLVLKSFRYSDFFLQKVVSGSLIIHEDQPGNFFQYRGDFDNIENVEEFAGVYNICIASNEELPKVGYSFFLEDYVTAFLAESIEQRYKNSWRFKIGNAVVAPFAFLKSLTIKSKQ